MYRYRMYLFVPHAIKLFDNSNNNIHTENVIKAITNFSVSAYGTGTSIPMIIIIYTFFGT
jgi:hypothetical protein